MGPEVPVVVLMISVTLVIAVAISVVQANLDKHRTEAEALHKALKDLIEVVEHADCRAGYCMCGDSVESHTFGTGHGPVDAGEYHAGGVLERTRELLKP